MPDASELLKKVGLRKTPGRVSLLNFLLHADKFLSPQEILKELKGRNLDRVTVYRNLHTFTESGLVHRIEVGDRVWRFAACHCSNQTHSHPHFTCRLCGRVECMEQFALPHLREPVTGYIVEEQEVYLRGICAACHDKARKEY
jgi:Fur family ferric uptake transcriptional regulator